MYKNESALHTVNTNTDSITTVTTGTSQIQSSSLNSSFDDSSNQSNLVNLSLAKMNNRRFDQIQSVDSPTLTNSIGEEKTLLTSIESSSISTSTSQKISQQINSNLSSQKFRFFSDIRSFTFFMCLIVMLTNALTVGYRNSVITTIEKRFEFSSVYSGILSGCLEVGSLITTLFVSYFCANSHIPKSIALSSLCCAIGSLLYALPHLISGSYTINNKVMNKTTNDLLCKSNIFYSSNSTLNNDAQAVKLNHKEVISFLNPFNLIDECLLKPSNMGYFMILIFASLLIGSSSAPLYTLGTTYIDNHVNKDDSSVYLAFIYSMLAFGPLIGYLVGAGFLQVYVDGLSYSIKDLKIDPSDSNWVGAWFVGFILFGFLIFFTSFPFFLFPKTINNKNQEQNISKTNDSIDDSSFGNLKTLPRAIKSILMNKVFMIVTFAFCFEITIISGFMTFLPKYIEHQFSVNNSIANIYTGGVAIPGACVGIVTGGFLVKKFKIDPKGASLMATVCNIACLFGIIILIFIGSANIKMAGTTTTYNSNSKLTLNPNHIETSEFKLISGCNADCQCSVNSIEPICGRNGITYFSPCYAGCTNFKDNKNGLTKQTYPFCKCIREDLANQSSPIDSSLPDAKSGACISETESPIAPFLLILFFITFLTALNQMPMLMVTLRSVTEIERAFALGLQLVIMRLLAYIPSPLIFGQAIDWTCLIWRQDECDKTGSCLFYDREKFRHIYGSIAAIYKGISLLLFIFLYFTVRKYNYKQKPIEITTIMKASVTSLNHNQHNSNQR